MLGIVVAIKTSIGAATLALNRSRRCPRDLQSHLPFLPIEIQLVDLPRLPTILFKDGNAQEPPVHRRRKVEPRMRLTYYTRRHHAPVLPIIRDLEAIRWGPPPVISARTLLSVRSHVDAHDPAACR